MIATSWFATMAGLMHQFYNKQMVSQLSAEATVGDMPQTNRQLYKLYYQAALGQHQSLMRRTFHIIGLQVSTAESMEAISMTQLTETHTLR